MLSGKTHVQIDSIKTTARVKYLPDDDGNYVAKSLTVFDRPTFMPDGWERPINRTVTRRAKK